MGTSGLHVLPRSDDPFCTPSALFTSTPTHSKESTAPLQIPNTTIAHCYPYRLTVCLFVQTGWDAICFVRQGPYRFSVIKFKLIIPSDFPGTSPPVRGTLPSFPSLSFSPCVRACVCAA